MLLRRVGLAAAVGRAADVVLAGEAAGSEVPEVSELLFDLLNAGRQSEEGPAHREERYVF
jgi:hypothetical protein